MSGPPPRAWGRREHGLLVQRSPRSTPTCVGTTTTSGRKRSHNTVHPHVRGDDTTMLAYSITGFGPPPRAWGRLDFGVPERQEDRSTPTCVGTTSPTSRPATTT